MELNKQDIQKSVPEKLLGEKSIPEIYIVVLDTHGTDRLISIFTVGTFNLRINAQFLYFSYSSSVRLLFGILKKDYIKLQIN